jgi:hypothetical protein
MNDYKELLNNDAYTLNLEKFKSITFIECENNLNFLEYLCYYEKTDIVQYCLEHPKYLRLIKDKNLLNDYCINISLEKSNIELIDYLLEKKLMNKKNILSSLDGFLLGDIDEKYLPNMNEEEVVLLGNKSIYHVKENTLLLALKNGFEEKDIELKNIYFCFKNKVNIKEKERVLNILKENFNISKLIANNEKIFNENKEEINNNIQCFETVIELIFKEMDIKNLCKNHFWTVLKIIKLEENNQTNYLKNKILLEYSNDFSQEDLQKIKKFNKGFWREIEKVRLYNSFKEKPSHSNFFEKKQKI